MLWSVGGAAARTAALALLAAVPWACSPAVPGGRPPELHNVLRVSSAEDVQGLNPHLSPQTITGVLSELTMAYLTRTDPAGLPRPELATDLPTRRNGGISPDGRTIVYHLRRDARWSDGAPFTAADVVFTTRVVKDPTSKEVRGYGFDQVAGVDALDPYTVRVRLKRPFAPLLSMFFGTSSGGPCLLPEHILAGPGALDRASYNELPVGIGPFRYVRWKRGDVVEFAANPNYFRGRPRLDTIVYKIIPDRNTLLAQMISGEVDLWLFPPRTYVDRLRAGSGIEVAEGIGAGVVFELLNERRPILNDRRVRRALLLADDREAVSRIFTHGRVPIGDALFPPGNPLYTDIGRTGHDPGRARAELAAAGWQLGPDGIRQKNGTRLTLHVATATGTEDFDQRIELLRQSYHEVGIELLVHHYPSSVLFGALGSGGILANGKFDLAPVGQLFSEPSDAASLFGCGMEPPRGFNFTGSCDPMLDRAMERLLDDYDVKRQRDDAIAVERRFAERLPALVDGYTQTFHAFGKGLRNFHPNPLVPLDDMMAVTI